MITGILIQDTVQLKSIAPRDTIRDSGHTARTLPRELNFQAAINTRNQEAPPYCYKNSIQNILFFDSTGSYSHFDAKQLQNFPFTFTEINRNIEKEFNVALVKQLKSGDELPVDLFHSDWILAVILLTVLLYGVIYSESLKFFKGVLKFVSFRGLNETPARDMGALFHWQSTLFNLASFTSISLFAFLTILWFGFISVEAERTLYWIGSFGIIVTAITLRHFVCVLIGDLSGEREIFNEYLIGIYQVYRLAGIFLLVISALVLYNIVIPLNILFYAGFSAVALLYFIRIFRLFLIFINRHVSIFYLILYLCALEILPVVVIIRFVTGLV